MGKATENTAIQARREYHKKWRAKNKERVREYNRRFWERQAAKQNETAAEQRTENSAK